MSATSPSLSVFVHPLLYPNATYSDADEDARLHCAQRGEREERVSVEGSSYVPRRPLVAGI